MLEAVKTGWGDGAVTGFWSRCRIFRLPAAWWRCGIGLTEISWGLGHGIVVVDPMCRKLRQIAGSYRLPGRDQPPQARERPMEAKPRGACEGSPGHGHDHHIPT